MQEAPGSKLVVRVLTDVLIKTLYAIALLGWLSAIFGDDLSILLPT
ncbi:hypothetical protein [uncultured Alsobacter sp.]|nr:hypothetical protein [uncultured Alsobacter sp.]